MKINKEIIQKLKQNDIDIDKGIIYLLSIYHDIKIKYILSTAFIRSVNLLKIAERDYEDSDIIWNIPLFVNQEIKWEWVSEYRQLFRSVRNDAGGNIKSCISKMKKYFVENSEVRKEQVIGAAKLYLTSFVKGKENPRYIQRADYFIFKGRGSDRTSRLEQYVEILEEQNKQSDKHKIIK